MRDRGENGNLTLHVLLALGHPEILQYKRQLDNIRMRDGGENGNLTLDHVLLALGHPEIL